MSDRFYIGMLDANASLQTSLKPFAIPDNAFAQLNNAYIFRGRVRKRFGARLMQGTTDPYPGLEQIQSRLKINLAVTSGASPYTAVAVPGAACYIGQAFSIDDKFFTVDTLGNAATLLTPPGSYTGIINTNTGVAVFTGVPAGKVIYFYPSNPVMGLLSYQQPAVNIEETIAFDTQMAYQYGANGWERLGTALWKGNNSDFFWGMSGRGTSAADINFYASNYFFGVSSADSDPMRYWNGSIWTDFTPGFTSGTPGNKILTARIIVFFKNRMVLFSVVENTGGGVGANVEYVNRVRWSWQGDPTNAAAFYDNIRPGGGFEDAPTKEAIITAQFLKDRLIVYFESSTWELVYTANQVAPFIWQKINTELGAESTFSQIPFDKVVLGVGNVGVHACNGSNVERIDNKIPDEVFDIHADYNTTDNNGIERVYGIRDYFTECVYWTFPDEEQSNTYPFNNRVLLYNYKTGSWALNDDSITCFGYYTLAENSIATSLTWAQASMTWEEADFTWRSPTSQATFRNVLAGNQEGFTFIVDDELSYNSPSLQVTGIGLPTADSVNIEAVNHNLREGDYVKITNIAGTITITDADGNNSDFNNGIYRVDLVSNPNEFNIFVGTGSIIIGTYYGQGLITRVTPIDILTKQYNFYADQGQNASISEVDFLVDRTGSGQFSVDFLIASSPTGIVNNAIANKSLIGTSVLDTSPYALAPYEQYQDRLWHPLYMWADGEYVQLHLYLNDAQTKNSAISESDFELHAMMFYARATSSKFQ